MLRVSPAGLVRSSRRVVWTLECKMSFGHLPFDSQQCGLMIAPYSASSGHIVLSGALGGLQLADITSVEWRISEPSTHALMKTHDGFTSADAILDPVTGAPAPVAPVTYAYVALNMRLDRLRGYYVQNIIVPCFVFNCIGFSGFFMPRVIAPARVAISVIAVLIMGTLRSGVFAALPRISYRIWLADLLFLSLLFSVVNVLAYGCVCVFLEARATVVTKRCPVRVFPIGSTKSNGRPSSSSSSAGRSGSRGCGGRSSGAARSSSCGPSTRWSHAPREDVSRQDCSSPPLKE